jgi:hypothetical protein
MHFSIQQAISRNSLLDLNIIDNPLFLWSLMSEESMMCLNCKQDKIDVKNRDIGYLYYQQFCDDCWKEMLVAFMKRDFEKVGLETLERIAIELHKARE